MHGRRSIALPSSGTHGGIDDAPGSGPPRCFRDDADLRRCAAARGFFDAAAGAHPVRGLHRGPGQQQRPHHGGAVRFRALRPGLPRPQRHRQVQQRQGRRRRPRHADGPEAVRAGVPRHAAQRLRPPHRRQLRLRRLWLRSPHGRARVGSHHGQPAGHVQGVQGEAQEHRRRAAGRRHRLDEPVPGGHRHRRPRQHLLHHAAPARLRPRVLHRVRRPVRLRLHPETVRHGRAAGEHSRRAAHRVRAVAAHQRRRRREGVRLPVQPGCRGVQRAAGEGDQAAQRHRAPGLGAQVHRPLHPPARHDTAPGRLRVRGVEPRVLRHGAVRGDADVQQVHGARLQRPQQVPLLGHLPSHRERLRHPHGAHHKPLRVMVRDAAKPATFGAQTDTRVLQQNTKRFCDTN